MQYFKDGNKAARVNYDGTDGALFAGAKAERKYAGKWVEVDGLAAEIAFTGDWNRVTEADV